MKKKMKLIFIISLLLLSLIGCASDSSDKVTDAGTTTAESVSKEQNVASIEDLSDSEAVDATEEEETKEEAATGDK